MKRFLQSSEPYCFRMTRVLAILAGVFAAAAAGAEKPALLQNVIGMYVHEHWPYRHPYAARTWTLDDWRGYADGLKKLGYNAIMIWPVIEVMPDPPTASDRASLEKHGKVIDILHREFGMRVMIALCPNVASNDSQASRAPFETRHFFYSDVRVNPADAAAVRRMIEHREELLRPLAKADAVAIIDSDPGGYPGSTNAEFVTLLIEHRKMLDRLRPGIELDYWVHAGWQAYGRFYQTAKFTMGLESEYLDAITRLSKTNPEPWGLANGLPYAEKLGLASRVISFNYGRIEGEPSFPMTNFGGDAAYEGGRHPGPRGVMGNAQTHCVQLPNTFAFARGALRQPVTEADYVKFAGDLIEGLGRLIVDGWKALGGKESGTMRTVASELERAADEALVPGMLKGLLFGDARRFLTDLSMQLRLRAAYSDLVTAARQNGDLKPLFRNFLEAAEVWQRQHGYQNRWEWRGMAEVLHKLNSPDVDAVLDTRGRGRTLFDEVKDYYYKEETFTPRLLKAMKAALSSR